MKLFECCSNCEHSVYYPGLVLCEVDGLYQEIKFPRFMGGSRRCECYERWHMFKKDKFQYPKKEAEE